jgi:DNA-binding CsgD family transcriptional regulator
MRASTQPLPHVNRAIAHLQTAHTPRRGFAECSLPNGGDDLRQATFPPHEIARLLRQLGVPFATFDPASRCTELSPAACALLGDEADHVCRLGARLLESISGDILCAPLDRPTDAASCYDPAGRHLLRARRLPHGDPRRAGIVLMLPVRGAAERLEPHRWGLSRREGEVASLVASGASTADVACALGISAHTVRRHTERIYAKVGVRSRMQLAMVLGRGPSRAATGTEK